MSDYLERKDKKRGHIWFLIGLAISFIILAFSDITNAAESDSLYYVSATDMIEKVNSVIGVCREDSILWSVGGDTRGNRFRTYKPTIVTRELIDVEVIVRPDSERVWENILIKNPQGKLEINGEKYSIVNYALIPGQMVVWWREVVQ